MVSTMMAILMYCSHELLTLEFLLQLGSGHDNDETLVGNDRYSTSVVTIACTVTSLVNMYSVIVAIVLSYKALLTSSEGGTFAVVYSTTSFFHEPMAVLIGNISIEVCHCKGFPTNDHVPF